MPYVSILSMTPRGLSPIACFQPVLDTHKSTISRYREATANKEVCWPISYTSFTTVDRVFKKKVIPSAAGRRHRRTLRNSPQYHNGRNGNIPRTESRRLPKHSQGASRRRNRIIRAGESQSYISVFFSSPSLQAVFCSLLSFISLNI
jgi:hypothetical protein